MTSTITTQSIEFVFELLSGTVHIGDTNSIQAQFRRVSMMDTNNNQIINVPAYSGNAIRNLLRRMAADYIWELLNIPPTISQRAFDWLRTGGRLESSGSLSFSLDEARDVANMFPYLSLWGYSLGNRIASGSWKASHLLPIAHDTKHKIPAYYHAFASQYAGDLVAVESYTRHDDARDPKWIDTFVPEQGKREGEASQQMRYHVETLIAGTHLYGVFYFDSVTEMERLAFMSSLAQFAKLPFIGAKSSVGHGHVRVHMSNGMVINDGKLGTFENGAIAPFDLSAYDTHLIAQKAEIHAWLAKL